MFASASRIVISPLMNVPGVTIAPASSVSVTPDAAVTFREAWIHCTSFFQHPTPVIGGPHCDPLRSCTIIRRANSLFQEALCSERRRRGRHAASPIDRFESFVIRCYPDPLRGSTDKGAASLT